MKTLSFIFLWKRHLKVFLFDASSVLNIKKCIFQQRNNIFTRVKPIKKIFFYLLWNQVKTFFQEKTFFSLPWVKPRQSMFFHVWHKKTFSQQEETFFQQKNLFLGEKLEKLSWNLETVKQKESMFVHVFKVFSYIFFLGEKLFSDHYFFRFI